MYHRPSYHVISYRLLQYHNTILKKKRGGGVTNSYPYHTDSCLPAHLPVYLSIYATHKYKTTARVRASVYPPYSNYPIYSFHNPHSPCACVVNSLFHFTLFFLICFEGEGRGGVDGSPWAGRINQHSCDCVVYYIIPYTVYRILYIIYHILRTTYRIRNLYYIPESLLHASHHIPTPPHPLLLPYTSYTNLYPYPYPYQYLYETFLPSTTRYPNHDDHR